MSSCRLSGTVTAMRKVALEDVRISAWGLNVVAAPLCAYEFNRHGSEIIAEAWSDIREELDRRYHAEKDGWPLRYRCCHLLPPARATTQTCRVCGESFMALKYGYATRCCTDKCAR